MNQKISAIVCSWTVCLGSAFAAIGSGDSDLFTIDNRSAALEYTLIVSSGSGGSVTEPGEGSFDYAAGTVVSISATVTADYEFVNWTGTAVNTGSVADPYAPDTSVRMDAGYTLQANFIRRTSPELILLSPNGGETLSAGSTHRIRWRNPPSETFTAFDIEYASEHAGWLQIVWISGGNRSSYTWDVPDITAHECLVRVSGIRAGGNPDISDTSDDVFSITGEGGLTASQRLRAHWQLDETQGNMAYSRVGINHGLVYGNPVRVPGLMAGALQLDGIDDYVDCGNDASLDITDEITLAAWVNPRDIGNSEGNPWIMKGNQSYAIKTRGLTRRDAIEFFIYENDWHTAHFTVAESFNYEWHHVAGTYDGSQLKLYIDGVLEVVTDYTGSIASTTHNVNIGRNSEATDHFYRGLIDDVRIYDCALNHAEIRELFLGIVAHWQLDETVGVMAWDSSDHGHHGTLYGNPTWLPTAGMLGGALEFDGNGDAVIIPAIGESVEFTYALWANQNVIEPGMVALIDRQQWAPGAVHFELRDGHPKVGINQVIYPDGDLDAFDYTLDPGEWYHLALTKSTQRLMMYVDGEPAAQRELTASDRVILGDGSIGQWDDSRHFNGLIDDVRIYEQALGPDDVFELFARPMNLQACCFADGSCLDLSPEECMAQGGMPQGEGTNCATTDCAPLPIAGLIAHWKLDEKNGITALDASGYHRHGTLYGNPTWRPTLGKVGGALEFDGNGDAVIIPALGQSVGFTHALWVNQTVIGTDLVALIDHKQWMPGSVHFELRDGHPKVGINQVIYPDGDLDAFEFTLDTGEWHHLVLTKSTQRLMMYVDGKVAAQRELTVSDRVILGDSHIGQWNDSRYFNGLIDDVRIYEQALEPGQVAELAH